MRLIKSVRSTGFISTPVVIAWPILVRTQPQRNCHPSALDPSCANSLPTLGIITTIAVRMQGGHGCLLYFLAGSFRVAGQMHNVMNTYRRLPVEFTHGEGIWLHDSQGRRYFDALSGIAVCGLGHAHPTVTQAIRLQAEKLLHVSNLFQIPNQERLAELLCQVSGLDNVFFCNSGAEANEAAIKLPSLSSTPYRFIRCSSSCASLSVGERVPSIWANAE